MKPIPSFLIASHARADLSRVTTQLFDLQRQTASSTKADDLKGYGSEAGRIVNARTAIAQSTARVDAANRLVARFEIQDAALDVAASAAATLKNDILTALSSDNGTFLAGQLEAAFQQATKALNTTHEGVALFAGERRDGAPVQAGDLDDLAAAIAGGTLFEDSVRLQTVDLGVGAPVTVAEKASTIASDLYAAFADLHAAIGGGLGSPISDATRAALASIADDLDGARQTVVDAQGRNGDAQARVERDTVRLSAHADLLSKHLAGVAEVDLAEVSIKLAAAKTQYQTIASVFSQLKDLSLVNFLQ